MPCLICKRESIGLRWYNPIERPIMSDMYDACSQVCQYIIMACKGKYDMISHNEKKAIEKGGQAGGEFLDKLGIYGLDKLSKEQYDEYCTVVFVATCSALQDMASKDVVPF